MSKSNRSRRTNGVNVGFEYFDRRQTGPWEVLRPLFRLNWGLVIPAGVSIALVMFLHVPVLAVVILMAVLFLWSFKLTWQIIALIVRSRAFLLVAAVLVVGNLWMRDLFGEVVGNILLVVLVVALLALRPTAPFLWARVWCVFDRHRIRGALKRAKVRTMNLDGALPFMLWARPTKTGERIWLWLPAGSAGDDIEDVLRYIAPACLAREARIHRVRKLTTVVGVEIIRRDPLGTGEKLPSPLAALVTYVKDTIKGEGTEAITPKPITDITESDPPTVSTAPRRSGRRTTTPVAQPVEPTQPTVVVAGEDLSDYID
jgi:hypothetical protein